MAVTNMTKARLIINGVGCIGIIAVCLPLCFSLASGLVSLAAPAPDDPDAGKAFGIYVFGIGLCSLLGIAALIALLRTVKTWRALAERP